MYLHTPVLCHRREDPSQLTLTAHFLDIYLYWAVALPVTLLTIGVWYISVAVSGPGLWRLVLIVRKCVARTPLEE